VKNGYSTMLSGLRLGLMVTGEGRSGPPRTGHPRLDFVAVSSHPTGVSILHRSQEKSSSTPFGPEDATSQLAVCSRPTVVKVAAGVRYAACRGRSVRVGWSGRGFDGGIGAVVVGVCAQSTQLEC
jgi:hypothetical protein